MKKDKVEIIKTKRGKEKIITQPNGIKVIILQKPNIEYRKKMDKIKAEHVKILDIKNKKRAENKLIKDEIRQIAIERLKEKGKL